MNTQITEITPVEYDLEITATADDIQPRIDAALKRLRPQIDMKGFRPGKVPMGIVRKLYGKQAAVDVVEGLVQETYERTVISEGEHQVLGSPVITDIDYEPMGDLKAVVRFGVRPEIELQDLSKHEVTKFVHEVTDEDIEGQIENLLDKQGDWVPTEEPATESDQVIVSLQRFDPETNEPADEQIDDLTYSLADPRLDADLKAALVGAKSGETVEVTLPGEAARAENEDLPEPARFEITVHEVKQKDMPELDDEFVKEFTEGRIETVDAFRDDVREQLIRSWDNASRENLEQKITSKMTELHPVPVPESVVNMYLDAFVADVKRRNEDTWPAELDEGAFREENREQAESVGRWMLVRDQFTEANGIEVTEADLDAHLKEMMGGDTQVDFSSMKKFYQEYGMLDQVRSQLMNKRLFDALIERFTIVEKSRDDFAPTEE
ncbi:MAG: trigger factor [Bacteroidota bacterium]